jgi:antigen flippase
MRASATLMATHRLLFAAHRGAAAIAQTIIARFAVAGIGLITGVLTARVLGAAGRGEQSAMIVWPALLPYLLTLGLPGAIRYWVRKEPERRSEFFTVAIGAAALTSIAALVIGMLFIPLWLHSYSADVIRDAQFLMIFAPEVMLGLIFTAMLDALGEFNVANGARYVTVSTTLVALVFLALTHHMTPFTAAISYSAAPIIVACWIGWHLRSYVTLRLQAPYRVVRVLASYAVRSYGIDVLNTMSAQVDQVLVIGLLGPADVGVYVVALSISRVITIMHSAVASVVAPSATGLSAEAVVAIVGRSARLSNAVAVILGVALAAVLPIVLPFFYGHAFDGAVPVAQVLTLEAILSGLVSVLWTAFMALGRPGFVTLLQAIGLAVVLPLMLVLLPRLGLLGAALALLASTLLRLTLILGSFVLILRVPIPSFVPTQDDFQRLRVAFAKH